MKRKSQDKTVCKVKQVNIPILFVKNDGTDTYVVTAATGIWWNASDHWTVEVGAGNEFDIDPAIWTLYFVYE